MGNLITDKMADSFTDLARFGKKIDADEAGIQEGVKNSREHLRIAERQVDWYCHGAAIFHAAGFTPNPEGGFLSKKKLEFKGSRQASTKVKNALIAGGMDAKAAQDYLSICRMLALGHKKGYEGFSPVPELASCKTPDQFGAACEAMNLMNRNQIRKSLMGQTKVEKAGKALQATAANAETLVETHADLTPGQKNALIATVTDEQREAIYAAAMLLGMDRPQE